MNYTCTKRKCGVNDEVEMWLACGKARRRIL